MAARPASIAEAFVRNSDRAPDRLCRRFEGEEWAYGRLRERAENFAGALAARSLRPGERVVAAVVRDDPGLSAEKVTEVCREDLASYKKPPEVVFVDALPRNALGKVLKHQVRKGLIGPEE